MTNPNMVKKNFSRNPVYYHNNAETQLYVASKLAKIIQMQPTGKIKRILEVGCGTGFLTEKLLSIFPNAEFTITDISPPMLQFCKQKTQTICSKKNIFAKFSVNDISQSCPKGDFDLIVSSLAFQWIDDLETTMQQIHNQLSENGTVLFSTLSLGTFASVKKVFDDFKIAFPSPKLLNIQEIISACKSFQNIDITDEVYIEKFDSMLLFLRHIQGTGAGNASGTPLSAKDLKKVTQYKKQAISAAYNIAYVVCTR